MRGKYFQRGHLAKQARDTSTTNTLPALVKTTDFVTLILRVYDKRSECRAGWDKTTTIQTGTKLCTRTERIKFTTKNAREDLCTNDFFQKIVVKVSHKMSSEFFSHATKGIGDKPVPYYGVKLYPVLFTLNQHFVSKIQ